MTAPAPLGPNVINNHIAKRAPSRHDNTKAIPENIVESEMRYASKGVGDEAADQEGHNDQEYARVTVVCQNIQLQRCAKIYRSKQGEALR